MAFAMFDPDVLALNLMDAGPLPSIIRAGREAQPLDQTLVDVFRKLTDGAYVMVGMTPRHGDKRDLEALSTVTSWNRAASREGLRADGCIFALRTVEGNDGPNYAVYIGRDRNKVEELDQRAAARLAAKKDQ